MSITKLTQQKLCYSKKDILSKIPTHETYTKLQRISWRLEYPRLKFIEFSHLYYLIVFHVIFLLFLGS